VLTLVLEVTGWLDDDFRVGEGGIGSLATVDVSTVGVAAAAGVAALLAFETRACAAVGVAISVTTIPAATYMGVAAGSHHLSDASGALAVLGINLAAMLTTGTATLAVQRGRKSSAAGPATWD